jgi:RHS repeat-associated protein
MTTPSVTNYYHYDGLGSVVNVSSATGGQEWTYSYDPFGGARSELQNDPGAPSNPLRFTGAYLDTTGYYSMGTRQQDPATGRFLVPDPLAQAVSSRSSYAYTSNQPTVLTDPSGASEVDGGSGGSQYARSAVNRLLTGGYGFFSATVEAQMWVLRPYLANSGNALTAANKLLMWGDTPSTNMRTIVDPNMFTQFRIFFSEVIEHLNPNPTAPVLTHSFTYWYGSNTQVNERWIDFGFNYDIRNRDAAKFTYVTDAYKVLPSGGRFAGWTMRLRLEGHQSVQPSKNPGFVSDFIPVYPFHNHVDPGDFTGKLEGDMEALMKWFSPNRKG